MLLQAEQMHKMTTISHQMVKLSFWVKIYVILSVAQLVTTVIVFSAWDKSRIKWDNSRNSTQKTRTFFISSDHVFSSIAGFCHVDSREPTFCGFGWAYTIFYQSKWGYRKASKGLKIHSKLALSKSINATKS